MAAPRTVEEQYRPLITRDVHVADGEPIIAGTRMPVWRVYALSKHGELSVDEILQEFPDLTMRQVKMALGYANDHEEEMERRIAEEEEEQWARNASKTLRKWIDENSY